MKKVFIIAALMLTGLVSAQSNEPVLEAKGDLVKATYYYDNGKVQQEGYFKDGKLEGTWITYDVNGAKATEAEYKDGLRTGKWIYYTDGLASREVNYANNQIASTHSFNVNGLADKN